MATAFPSRSASVSFVEPAEGPGRRTGRVPGGDGLSAAWPFGLTGPADQDRLEQPADLLATVDHVLGIDSRQTFRDHTGRPIAILDEGEPIAELIPHGPRGPCR
jgi:hypothetical protein